MLRYMKLIGQSGTKHEAKRLKKAPRVEGRRYTRTGKIDNDDIEFWYELGSNNCAVYFKYNDAWWSLPAHTIKSIDRVGVLDAEKDLMFTKNGGGND